MILKALIYMTIGIRSGAISGLVAYLGPIILSALIFRERLELGNAIMFGLVGAIIGGVIGVFTSLITFVLVEWIFRRPLSKKIVNWIVTVVVILVLLLLSLISIVIMSM